MIVTNSKGPNNEYLLLNTKFPIKYSILKHQSIIFLQLSTITIVLS